MKDEIRQALDIGLDSSLAGRTIDITTTGRQSGEERRIEIVFWSYNGEIYLSGIPRPQPRAWLLNLAAEPNFTFHLKQDVVADLPATATVITDERERRRILEPFVDVFNRRRDPDGPYPVGVLDEWVEHSPLAKVSFDESG